MKQPFATRAERTVLAIKVICGVPIGKVEAEVKPRSCFCTPTSINAGCKSHYGAKTSPLLVNKSTPSANGLNMRRGGRKAE